MENKTNLENVKLARRLLAKARYLSKIASDEKVDPLTRRDIAKAIFYLYRCAFSMREKTSEGISSELLKELARQAGI